MKLAAILLALIVVAVGTALFLLRHDRGAREPVSAIWESLGFGALAVLVVPLVYHYVPLVQKLDEPVTSLWVLAAAALVVAIVEELAKFVPLALFMWRRPYFNEHTDGVVYFALAGLAFGLGENLIYTLAYGADAGAVRLLLLPFFHGALTALIGYALIKVKLKTGSWSGVWLALLAAIGLHAGYDWLAAQPELLPQVAGFVVGISVNLMLFWLYIRAGQLDAKLGLTGSSVRWRSQLVPHRGRVAVFALIIGLLALPLAMVPIIGWVAGLTAVVVGSFGLNSPRHGSAVAAIVFGSLGFTVALGWFGVALAANPVVR